MDGSKEAATARALSSLSSGCAVVERQQTIGEVIDEAIEKANRDIVRLMALKADAQARGFMNLLHRDVAKFAHPSYDSMF